MKRFLIVLLTFALVAGLAFAGGNKDSEPGEWSVGGRVILKGEMDFGKGELGEKFTVADNVTGGLGTGDDDVVDVTMSKTLKSGTEFSAGVKYNNGGGFGLSAGWEKELGDVVFTTDLELGRGFKVTFGFENEDLYGVTIGANNATFGWNNGLWNWNFNDLTNYWALSAAKGWFKVMDGQLRFDVAYIDGVGDNRFRFASEERIVSQTWDGGDQSFRITFKPNFLDGLTVGMGFHNILQARTINATYNGWVRVGPEGALDIEEALIDDLHVGVKFENDAFGFFLEYANNTMFPGWAGGLAMNRNPGQDNWLPFVGLLKSNIQAGLEVNVGDLRANLDLMFAGMYNLAESKGVAKEGAFGIGFRVGYDADAFDASLKMKFIADLSEDSDHGFMAIEPHIGFDIIPDTLSAEINLLIDLGIGEKRYASFKDYFGFKVNPSLTWNPMDNIEVGLGYTAVITSRSTDDKSFLDKSAINMSFKWSF